MSDNEKVHYDSMSAFSEWLDSKRGTQAPGARWSSEKNAPKEDWDLDTSLDATFEYKAKGYHWEGGSRLLQKAVKMLNPSDSFQPVSTPTLVNSVVGFMPDVPAYLAGEVESMMTTENLLPEMPVVSIGINIGGHSGICSKTFRNRGAAVVSLIDKFESEGKRVELVACVGIRHERSSVDWSMVIKQSDEHWSPETIAFVCCHPAFFRRFLFMVIEWHLPKSTSNGYGKPSDGDLKKDFDLYFPHVQGNNGWGTPKEAFESVNRYLPDVE